MQSKAGPRNALAREKKHAYNLSNIDKNLKNQVLKPKIFKNCKKNTILAIHRVGGTQKKYGQENPIGPRV